jgi:hypothetical protein
VIAEIAPQARVIHYTHGLEDYDTISAARVLETVQFIMNVGWASWLAVLVVYAVRPGPVGLSRFGFGLLFAILGAGGVVGSLITEPALRLLGRRWAIGADILGTGAMMATRRSPPTAGRLAPPRSSAGWGP